MVYRKESLLKWIEKLKGYFRDLQDIESSSLEKYVKAIKDKYAAERLLFLICKTILDSLDHILASRFGIVSDSYEDIIENAYKRKIIKGSIYKHLKGLGGFRNVLAHEYLDLSDDEIYKNLKKMMRVESEVIAAFEDVV